MRGSLIRGEKSLALSLLIAGLCSCASGGTDEIYVASSVVEGVGRHYLNLLIVNRRAENVGVALESAKLTTDAPESCRRSIASTKDIEGEASREWGFGVISDIPPGQWTTRILELPSASIDTGCVINVRLALTPSEPGGATEELATDVALERGKRSRLPTQLQKDIAASSAGVGSVSEFDVSSNTHVIQLLVGPTAEKAQMALVADIQNCAGQYDFLTTPMSWNFVPEKTVPISLAPSQWGVVLFAVKEATTVDIQGLPTDCSIGIRLGPGRGTGSAGSEQADAFGMNGALNVSLTKYRTSWTPSSF